MGWKPDDVKRYLKRLSGLLPTIARASEFLVSIHAKVTYISFYGKETRPFLENLADSKGPGSCMPRLQKLTISGAIDDVGYLYSSNFTGSCCRNHSRFLILQMSYSSTASSTAF